MTLLSLLLAFSAFALLATAMPRHAREIGSGAVATPHLLRWAGLALLAASSLVRLAPAPNRGFALVEWTGELTVAAAATTALLFVLPRAVFRIGVAVAITSLITIPVRF